MLNVNKWQLGVIDWDMVKGKSAELDKAIEHDRKTKGFLDSGTVVYIVDVFKKAVTSEALKALTNPLLDGNVIMVCIWVPKYSYYACILLKAVHPICTEKDVVEMEMKFDIKLDDMQPLCIFSHKV